MTSEAVAKATLEQELDSELDPELDDFPTLSSVVQSGDIEAIQFAREHFVSEDHSYARVANDTSNSPAHLPEMVFEGDLESTIDAIIDQHVNSMRAEIRAILALHIKETEKV